MIVYRPYRNTDPPAILECWNETCTSRGAAPIRLPIQLERWIFSKLYFQPRDMMVAVEEQEESKKVVGFALSGFGPNEDQNALKTDVGIVCAVIVRPEFKRHGIGGELLRRAAADLRERGAKEVVVGAMWPGCPYLFGIYGGSNSPGILASELAAEPFLQKQGYVRAESCIVMQKKLDAPVSVADTRFGVLRRRYEFQAIREAGVATWWQDSVWGLLEPVEMRLTDKLTNFPAARAVIWELEGYSWKWKAPSAGILAVQVRPDLRRQGLGKLLLAQVLRFLEDQRFELVELQIAGDDVPGLGLCKSLGFEEADRGYVYRLPGTFTPPVKEESTAVIAGPPKREETVSPIPESAGVDPTKEPDSPTA